MENLEIVLVGIGLAMDAFAVSICKGLSMNKISVKKTITVGIYFGIFQAIMPIIGYLLGATFDKIIIKLDHWVAFCLLSIIGINMLKEAFSKNKEHYDDSVRFKTMCMLALATSIDALAVGITFAFLRVNIIKSIIIIGVVTFVICAIGVKIGNKFGNKYEKKSQMVGGVILILMGIRILLEHLKII